MPILWFEQRVTMSPEMVAEIVLGTSLQWIGRLCSVIVSIIGLVMVLWFPLHRLSNRTFISKNRNDETAAVVCKELETKQELEHSQLLMGKKVDSSKV